MVKKIGFLVNPYAGSGGRIGRKGSDNLFMENPEIPNRVKRFLNKAPENALYITAMSKMGEIYFINTKLKYETIDVGKKEKTSREDTISAVKEFVKNGVDIIVFVGGDGTARDVYEGLQEAQIPILGVPAGVKMHSGVFANTPEAAAILLSKFLNGEAKIVREEILDVDEDAYRSGRYTVRLYYTALTISSNNLLTPSKEEIAYEKEELEEIANYILDNMDYNSFYIMGPGSTVKYIESKLDINTSFLGIDIIKGRKLIRANANYFDLLNLTGELKVVLTPIGKQGFLIGRGNLELGPLFLRKINKNNLIVVSPLSKLYTIDCLRIDTGDENLDSLFSGVYNVIVGYNKFYAVKTCDKYY
ncbi:ATP-NAD kinase family protein [Sulfolobus tengchongensis]|uniref:ATP-NAD kinase family protein n=1 Tax=Sulfolobus tengchongensis TaxID=207809 RepID=A0AAX4L0B8_9CREN